MDIVNLTHTLRVLLLEFGLFITYLDKKYAFMSGDSRVCSKKAVLSLFLLSFFYIYKHYIYALYFKKITNTYFVLLTFADVLSLDYEENLNLYYLIRNLEKNTQYVIHFSNNFTKDTLSGR